MSHRVKSQEELEREEADARLARQLMEEEQAQLNATRNDARVAQQMQQQQQQRMQQQQVPPSAYQQQQGQQHVLRVMCPTCQSINNIHPANAHLHHMCGTCRRVLPRREPGAGPQHAPQQQPSPAPAPQQQPPQQSLQQNATVRCSGCQADNILPLTGQMFKCGHCGQLLQAPSAPARTSPQPQPQPQQPPQQQQPRSTVLQATALEGPRNLEIRCGRCPAINNVPENPNTPGQIQFKCGSCGALNKANY